MKQIVTFTLILLPILVLGQNMTTVFKLLPEYCTPELDYWQRDILLQNKEYVVPGGDSIETVKYDFEVDEVRKFISYTYYFTTGQRGFINFEVKKFTKTDGSSIIIFSRYSGMPTAFSQTEIVAFDYKNGKLIRKTKDLLPTKLGINVFLRENTPDSIKNHIELYSSYSYDLSSESNNSIEYRIYFAVNNDEFEKYLLGDTIIFRWTGKYFRQERLISSE